MRISLLLSLIVLLAKVNYAQIDTINYQAYDTYKEETIIQTKVSKDDILIRSKTKRKKSKYKVEDKNVSEKEYIKANKKSVGINDCKPCWLKIFDKNGKINQEGLSYFDCALGKRTEYYENGKIKVVRFYKTNENEDWISFPCSFAQGTWLYYGPEGNLLKTETYTDGLIVE